MSFLPLAHMFERCCEAAVFMVGSRVGFFGGDIRSLSDDMKVLKVSPAFNPFIPQSGMPFPRMRPASYSAHLRLKASLIDDFSFCVPSQL